MGLSIGKALGSLAGFQTGGVSPRRTPSPSLADASLTKGSANSVLQLLIDAIEGIQGGDMDKFFPEAFNAKLMRQLVPLRAQFASNRNRVQEFGTRTGADENAIARLLANLGRDEGSQVARVGEGIEDDRLRFFENLITTLPSFVTSQQGLRLRDEDTMFTNARERSLQRDARLNDNAANLRRIVAGINLPTGGSPSQLPGGTGAAMGPGKFIL